MFLTAFNMTTYIRNLSVRMKQQSGFPHLLLKTVNFNRVLYLTFSSKAYEPGKLVVKKFQTIFSDVPRFK